MGWNMAETSHRWSEWAISKSPSRFWCPRLDFKGFRGPGARKRWFIIETLSIYKRKLEKINLTKSPPLSKKWYTSRGVPNCGMIKYWAEGANWRDSMDEWVSWIHKLHSIALRDASFRRTIRWNSAKVRLTTLLCQADDPRHFKIILLSNFPPVKAKSSTNIRSMMISSSSEKHLLFSQSANSSSSSSVGSLSLSAMFRRPLFWPFFPLLVMMMSLPTIRTSWSSQPRALLMLFLKLVRLLYVFLRKHELPATQQSVLHCLVVGPVCFVSQVFFRCNCGAHRISSVTKY